MDRLNNLVNKDLVIGQPNLCFKSNRLCDVCNTGKQVRAYFKAKKCYFYKPILTTFAHGISPI